MSRPDQRLDDDATLMVISGPLTSGQSGVALATSAFDLLLLSGTVFQLTRADDFMATERSA